MMTSDSVGVSVATSREIFAAGSKVHGHDRLGD